MYIVYASNIEIDNSKITESKKWLRSACKNGRGSWALYEYFHLNALLAVSKLTLW